MAGEIGCTHHLGTHAARGAVLGRHRSSGVVACRERLLRGWGTDPCPPIIADVRLNARIAWGYRPYRGCVRADPGRRLSNVGRGSIGGTRNLRLDCAKPGFRTPEPASEHAQAA